MLTRKTPVMNVIITFLFLSSAYASAAIERRANPKVLSQDQINIYNPFANYAAAAYCQLSAVAMWDCGYHCSQLLSFSTIASGGDDGNTPLWYVGYDNELRSVILGRSGEDVGTL